MAEAIAQPLRNGNAAAAESSAERFEDLYRRTSRRVYAYVASLMRDTSAAEEVTAQTFERAYRKRSSFVHAAGALRPGCSGSPATPHSTSCGVASAERRSRSTSKTPGAPAPRTRSKTESGAPQYARRSPRSISASATSWRSSSPRASRTWRSPGCWGSRRRARGTRLHRAIEKLREACDEEL